MSSSADNKTCGVCYGSLQMGKAQAIFTAECSHSFHFCCIANNSDNLCHVCGAKWNDMPFALLNSNARDKFCFSPFSTPQRPFPRFSHVLHPPGYPIVSAFELGPFEFFDDEPWTEPVTDSSFPFSDDKPLPENITDPTFLGLTMDSVKVTIKAIPERPAVAASDSLAEFTVLVGLKAPTLSEDAHHFQRAPIDLVMVLDVSGSMYRAKMSLMKQAVHFVIDSLCPYDRLSIVSFADTAERILPLCRMIGEGRDKAKRAVDSLYGCGSTNIVHALKMGGKVLEDRRQQNPVSTIIFLSDDHDPVAMHAIADASGGTFSFIESCEMLQDAFASCIGGLLSVVTQELCLNVRSASHGVEIKPIPSGRYTSEISNQGSQAALMIGDLYADEEKEFLINLSFPSLPNDDEDDDTERKMSLLDITCSYRHVVSKDMLQLEGDLVEIRRPKTMSPLDMTPNLEVDRHRNRLSTLLAITEAQQIAETGNLTGAQAVLSMGRSGFLTTASVQARDTLCMWLDTEMEETQKRIVSPEVYMRQGRAYALSGMSSHTSQRAAWRGNTFPGAEAFGSPFSFSSASSPSAKLAVFGAYATPTMANMVAQSQQQSKPVKGVSPMRE